MSTQPVWSCGWIMNGYQCMDLGRLVGRGWEGRGMCVWGGGVFVAVRGQDCTTVDLKNAPLYLPLLCTD